MKKHTKTKETTCNNIHKQTNTFQNKKQINIWGHTGTYKKTSKENEKQTTKQTNQNNTNETLEKQDKQNIPKHKNGKNI